ncbi:MAG: dihydrofolate reductase [Candidatus Zambryskibacteria bacterium CG22_combo_CG10-13_8_21_14_all_42_17]|uniref:Dihydrofolate reductase n=1 Tax=Candidatus Zambryskibacteria bacterium CG22_combo_CG10-13_8_21_14_all_42_17 TaxID=1975118 RepID=A0A2H0BD78_9BACT|nr:MAG: dihydrofolate reductase [Candidatus Zambryskibacteria bacterium CG22_combo_CG10-13_8_21_14_all_42_17]
MKYKVLITAPYFQLIVDQYQHIFDQNNIELVIPKVNERMSEEELLGLVGEIDGILCGDDRITDKVLASAPKLKVIVKWGTGIDSIDTDAAQRRGIPIRNTPNAFTEPVADTILSYILCFARGTIDLDRKVREGVWEKKLNVALNECALGVIGVGNIGKAVIKRAEAFGMKILANDIKDIDLDFMVPLDKLLKESDFVSLCCDLNPTSYHLINRETIGLMKPTAYLINAARGTLIEEGALIEALNQKKIAGVALDVFEDEPLIANHPFKQMSNVILSPHNANASPSAWERVHENSISSLMEELTKAK